MSDRILHLTLKKKWFDLIANKDKIIEYRQCKPYWIERLDGKTFDEVHFRNGYAKDSPFMRVEWLGCRLMNLKHEPANGEVLNGLTYGILLGEILEERRK